MRLALVLDGKRLDELLAPTLHPVNGWPGLPTQMRMGLQYLKYAYARSDEAVLAGGLKNPYFCGGVYFAARPPGVVLRQNDHRVAKRALRRQRGDARAQPFARARRATKKRKPMLGRVSAVKARDPRKPWTPC